MSSDVESIPFLAMVVMMVVVVNEYGECDSECEWW